jgi:serine/threonine-protein kinase
VTLQTGTRFGSYEILALVGKGGMGEVYRALDHKLGREVALKLLPQDFSQDRERLSRFEREARILASLNHPNIATLHGLEESGDDHFLIMELVPGETLAERISQGPIPLDEAVPLFRQIAAALEAAHEKGIIHRDLKPANIKITPDGNVRVLDFGLAKVFEDAPLSDDLSHSPTVTREGTRVATILGTAAYMSPEQTRGKRLDRRTDLWAFGCCLFEALSGSKAFDGETVTDVFAAIVRGEPDWNRLPAEIPAALRVLLQRCLTKDPAHRRRDAGDAAIELDEVLKRPSERPPTKARSISLLVACGLGLALLALGVGIGSLLPRERNAAGPVKSLDLALPEGMTLGDLEQHVAVFSPDGERLAIIARTRAGRDQLYVRTLADSEMVPIPLTGDASLPFFSPDGEWIGFSTSGGMKKISVRGGAPIPISSASASFGAAWGEDGTIVFGRNSAGLLRVPASGGEPRKLSDHPYQYPVFLPGGRNFLAELDQGISVVTLETGESKILIENGGTPRYVASGHLVYEYLQSLYGVGFDLERLEVRGTPVPLGKNVRRTVVGPALYDVARDGSLLYVPGTGSMVTEKYLLWVERDGSFEKATQTARAFSVPRLSPDGRRIAFGIAEGRAAGDVWVHDLRRDSLQRVTFGGSSFAPVWSPDGTQLTYTAQQNDTWALLRTDADGSGAPEEILDNGHNGMPVAEAWLPDGRTLLYSTQVKDRGWDEFLLTIGERRSRSLVSSPDYDAEGSVSPDGNWIVYTSAEAGISEPYVEKLTEPGRKWRIADRPCSDPVWTSNGNEIVCRSGRRILSIAVRTEPDFEASVPRVLFEGPFELETSGYRNFDVTPDGQRFIMIQSDEQPLDQLEFVVNWVSELKRLVPN